MQAQPIADRACPVDHAQIKAKYEAYPKADRPLAAVAAAECYKSWLQSDLRQAPVWCLADRGACFALREAVAIMDLSGRNLILRQPRFSPWRIWNVENTRRQITVLLAAAGNGDRDAAERLWRAVYDELRLIAKARMAREGRRGDLQTTVLVQEAYLRLVGNGDGAAVPANRRHFFAAAANAMRQFLVDHARKRGAQKRRDDRRQAEFAEPAAPLDCDPSEVLALDEALAKLRKRDELKAEIVQLRYFAGLSIDETAEVLGISPRQVDKDWQFAKAWLHRELS